MKIIIVHIFLTFGIEACDILPQFVRHVLEESSTYFGQINTVIYMDEFWNNDDITGIFLQNVAIINLQHMTLEDQEQWIHSHMNFVEDSLIIAKTIHSDL